MSARTFILLIASLIVTAACSTIKPVKNKREGVFDKWAKMESVGDAVKATAVAKPAQSTDSAEAVNEEELSDAQLDELKRFASRWQWPLKSVHVTSTFGTRGKNFHEGLDLKAASGTDVFAADAGVVAYAGRKLRGYGKMVIIRHGKGLATVYAHNSKLLVKGGQKIRKGQKIARSGQTGHASGPHLHFEVRHGALALNPSFILPRVAGTTVHRRMASR